MFQVYVPPDELSEIKDKEQENHGKLTKALKSPNRTPIKADAKNIKKNRPTTKPIT